MPVFPEPWGPHNSLCCAGVQQLGTWSRQRSQNDDGKNGNHWISPSPPGKWLWVLGDGEKAAPLETLLAFNILCFSQPKKGQQPPCSWTERMEVMSSFLFCLTRWTLRLWGQGRRAESPGEWVKLAKAGLKMSAKLAEDLACKGRPRYHGGPLPECEAYSHILKQNTNTFSVPYFCSKSLQLWYVWSC